jgi:C-terminal peptidase prc
MGKKNLLILTIALILPLAGAVPGLVAEGTTHPCVVLVGVGKYADPQILSRPFAEDDVKALYDVITSKEYLGIDPQHVRLLLSEVDPKRPSQVATHQNIVDAFKWAASNAGRDDLVLVALVMQGAPLGERSCYLAADSTLADRAKNAVSASEIETALSKLRSHRFCALLDVNFKGFKSDKGGISDLNLASVFQEFMGKEKEEAGPPPGRTLFVANTGSNGLRPSLDGEKHGVFSEVVLEALRGSADKDGYEPDGVVTLDELVNYMNKEYRPRVQKYAKTKEEREHGYLILGGRSQFELSRNPQVTTKVRERLERFARLVSDKNISKELSEEGRKLLSRMPKLDAERNLRKAYQQLADGGLALEDFKKERTAILDGMKLEPATAKRFASKIIQATQLINKEYVKEVNQGELVASAVRGLYSRLGQELPKDVADRLIDVKNMKEDALTNLLTDIRLRLGKREDLANHKDIDYALQRMMMPLDPYTTYIDPEQLAQFKREMGGNFTGIGVQIRVDLASSQLLVVTPILGSPAHKAGMQAGDIITTVIREHDSNGNKLVPPETIPTKGMAISDAVKKIIGKPGTKVKLTVEREGVEDPIEFEITRGTVEMESVLGFERKSDDSWDYLLDPQSRIAYVRVTQFSRFTERDLRGVIKQLARSGGIKGLILDVRSNPGGLLTSAVNISDMFIDDGTIVTIKPRVGESQLHKGEHRNSLLDFPMVCLVNGHSASGSEIVAACLQDHERAIVMGERSYGKGSVQNIQPFEEGEIKLTTASFWRPNGKNLNKSTTKGKEDEDWGVTPNPGYTIKLSPKERDELEEHLHKKEIIPRRDLAAKNPSPKPPFKDVQLETALKYLRNQIKLAAQPPARKAG